MSIRIKEGAADGRAETAWQIGDERASVKGWFTRALRRPPTPPSAAVESIRAANPSGTLSDGWTTPTRDLGCVVPVINLLLNEESSCEQKNENKMNF